MWTNVFSVEAFSGVNIHRYFTAGDESPATPTAVVNADQIYRHNDMIKLLSEAKFIRFSVFDLDLSRAQYLIFETVTEDNFESWFTWDRVYYSSSWNFQGRRTGGRGNKFMIRDPSSNERLSNLRFFQIYDYYEGNNCIDVGWFVALSKDPYALPYCPYEKWWNRADYVNAFPLSNVQSPAFYYTDTLNSLDFNYHKLGGKISIDVLHNWTLIWLISAAVHQKSSEISHDSCKNIS